MGQSNYNPTALLAKEGKIPPKPRRLGKRERERILKEKIERLYPVAARELFEEMQQKYERELNDEQHD
jgi:hypothetical protein